MQQDSKLFSAIDTICFMDGTLLDQADYVYMDIKYNFSHAFVRQSTK